MDSALHVPFFSGTNLLLECKEITHSVALYDSENKVQCICCSLNHCVRRCTNATAKARFVEILYNACAEFLLSDSNQQWNLLSPFVTVMWLVAAG